MSIVEFSWTPTIDSVSKKNTKYQLAHAIMKLWEATKDCKDKQTKKKILDILMLVL